ncbi:MDR family NADP-dependent oxidoreductase [Novosphingobium barchaimii]|uniref:MDR family NADP-dependent oxidoreductase n=1 Tax=Novosphingobium barchaimii TaxID=1420591 RepID=UPI0009EB0B32|nr:NADP-dependent oxidoreductase [Novosphingobium barchaimii]
MSLENEASRRVTLSRYPEGRLRADDFKIETGAIPEVAEGSFLVRNLVVSVDPMLRIFIDRKPLGISSMPSLPLGATIPGAAVGEVVESRHPDYQPGDIVEGRFGWQDHAVSNGQGVNRVPRGLGGVENALGIGGLPGFTAYIGLETAGGVKPGHTFLVSGAAGAVGSAVGSLIRARGGRAVGIVGGEDKRRYLLDEVGYDAVADRLSPDFHAQLAQALPNGANVYFDNVGGPLLAEMMPYVAFGGLVLICGLMSQYQDGGAGGDRDNLPSVLHAVMGKGIRIESFSQYGRDALRPAFEAEITDLLAKRSIKPLVHIVDGLERLPQAQIDLFENSTTGKVVVRVAEAGAR